MPTRYDDRYEILKIDLEQLRPLLELLFRRSLEGYTFAIESLAMDRNESVWHCALDAGERKIVFCFIKRGGEFHSAPLHCFDAARRAAAERQILTRSREVAKVFAWF